MSKTSKSPLTVARTAYEAGQKALPRYAHKFSRKDFTCAQLFAVLVLRKFMKEDYRGVIAYLAEWQEMRQVLELHDKLPHFTTPQKASKKLLADALMRKLLKQTLDQAYKPHRRLEIDGDDMAYVLRIDQAAADSTGLESGHCSKYFTKRKQRKNKGDPSSSCRVSYRRFPKLGLVVDCARHLILSMHRTQGPRPDTDELLDLMNNMTGDVWPEQLLADAGYDSEDNHEVLSIESVIPPTAGRPSDNLPEGKWRWLMATDFNHEAYGQRWQAKTVMFMLKARQGESLTARSYHARRREMGLMGLTYNLMVVALAEPFYRAGLTPFLA